MKNLATASLIIIILIAGCSTSRNDSRGSVSIAATQPTAWEGTGDYIEFVIDLGSPNETDGNIIVYFDAAGTALDRNNVEGNTDLQNGFVEIPPHSHHHKAIRIESFTSDGIITETQPITLRLTGCSSDEYSIGPVSEATAVVMDGDGPTVTDIDGNVYRTVLIGSQTWIVENLKTVRYRNGDPVTNSWVYNNDLGYGNFYGRLYDWYAATDARGLAPAGWHIPSDEEWTQLSDYLGGEDIAGKKMKSSYDWKDCDDDCKGTNVSGFTALPGGGGNGYDGAFEGIGNFGLFWSSSEIEYSVASGRALDYMNSDLFLSLADKETCLSVRCVRD